MFIKGVYWEPQTGNQEYNRNIIERKDPGSYIPVVFRLYSWGSLNFPIKSLSLGFRRCLGLSCAFVEGEGAQLVLKDGGM